MSKYCCGAMEADLKRYCTQHPNRFDCPDALIRESSQEEADNRAIADIGVQGRFGLYVHDGGSSFVELRFCPWCGHDLMNNEKTIKIAELEKFIEEQLEHRKKRSRMYAVSTNDLEGQCHTLISTIDEFRGATETDESKHFRDEMDLLRLKIFPDIGCLTIGSHLTRDPELGLEEANQKLMDFYIQFYYLLKERYYENKTKAQVTHARADIATEYEDAAT